MEKETILETNYASLWFYPQLKIIHHQFHKPVIGEEFLKILTTGIEKFEKFECNKWLSDDRKLPILQQKDRDWLQENMDHRLKEAGFKYWAMVLPENVIGALSIENDLKHWKNKGIKVKVFEDPTIALEWLAKIENH
jgi:hypothetical protein